MVSNKMFFFHVQVPQLNIVILKNFTCREMFCKMFFFFSNLSQGNFLYCPTFFILTKNLNAVRTPTEMK